MRRINIEPYMETIRDATTGEDTELPYDVKTTMIELLLARDLALSASEALARQPLVCMIRDSADGFILLEEADYKKLKDAIDTVKGWSRTDFEFLNRVVNAPEVEVEEKIPKED